VTSVEDHRVILGVGRRATAAEIHAAYRRAAKRAHPDLGGSSEAFQRVQAALEALLGEAAGSPSAAHDRPPPHQGADRASREGHWTTLSAELKQAWGLSGDPATVLAPPRIGLSPFVAGADLNAPAFAWLTQVVGPRGECWDFNVTDSVARIFFRSGDDARRFKLRFV
jgi:hypothetical protein